MAQDRPFDTEPRDVEKILEKAEEVRKLTAHFNNDLDLDPVKIIAEARKMRGAINFVVTDEELKAWIEEGRL